MLHQRTPSVTKATHQRSDVSIKAVCMERPAVAPPRQQQQRQQAPQEQQQAAQQQQRMPLDCWVEKQPNVQQHLAALRYDGLMSAATVVDDTDANLLQLQLQRHQQQQQRRQRPHQQQRHQQQQQLIEQSYALQEDLQIASHLKDSMHSQPDPLHAPCLIPPGSLGRRRRRPQKVRFVIREISSSSSSSTEILVQRPLRHAWTRFHSKLLQSLRREEVLPKHARVLVAVSGGQDSMAMLRLLHDLHQQQHWPLQFVVGHCDHRVRPDSAENAAHVQQFCEGLGLSYMQAVADREPGHWPEAAARDWRRQQLVQMALDSDCTHLALGHTATERAETVMYNMIRGAGLRGMGAMGWSRTLQPGLQLVRPLLDFSRPETLEACDQTGTEVYPDSTNSDPRYVRNRLRLSVFPLLQAINNAAVSNICSVARIAEAEEDFMAAVARFELMGATVRVVLAPPTVAAPADAPAAPADAAEPGQAFGGHASLQDSSGKIQAPHQLPLQQERVLVLNTEPAADGLAAAAAAAAAGVLDDLLGEPHSHSYCYSHWYSYSYSSHGLSRGGGVFGLAALEDTPKALPGCDINPSQPSGKASAEPLASQQQQQWFLQQQQRGTQQCKQQQQGQQQQQRKQQEACFEPKQEYHQALCVSQLRNIHSALLRRVIHLWLSAHSSKSVKQSQVQEVEQLLKHKQRRRQSSGAKTSTLWGSSCVLMHQGLLLLLDASKLAQVSSGELQVHWVAGANASSTAPDPATLGISVSVGIGMPMSAVFRHVT